jgi:hypothetical protein
MCDCHEEVDYPDEDDDMLAAADWMAARPDGQQESQP